MIHYLEEQVLRKRPEINPDWCMTVIASPHFRQVQADDRIRLRGAITHASEPTRILRVVTLDDGDTVHNALFDRGFRKEQS